MRHAIGVMLLVAAGSANAVPVVWTLNDVTFNDGGIATGSFTFDANTGNYSDISIQTTAGTTQPIPAYPGTSYGDLNPSTVIGQNLLAYETGAADYGLALDWLGNLSNSGGSLTLQTGISSNEIDLNVFATRLITGGSISAIPIPAAVYLFASGLGLLGWMRRRQLA
jgi:hypothetical protein